MAGQVEVTNSDSRITPRMLLDAINELRQETNAQFSDLRRELSALPPRCSDHEARLKQVESTTQVRTWESRLYGLIAAVAAALGVKGVQ